MNIYKIANLPVAEVKFKEWKIKENSKLSVGSVILTYEYVVKSTGATKTDKIKSNLNEITVKELYKFNQDDVLKSGLELFSYEKCKHPIISNEMCAVCGEDLKLSNEMLAKKKLISTNAISSSSASRKTTITTTTAPHGASVRIVHAEPKLKVSETEALEIGKKDLINLVKNKKLVLLVDLDHTLIHTTNDNVRADLKEVHHYELWQKNVWYHTKFRPNCNKFLEEMSKLYELHMVTFGERNYAHTIAKLMDPDHRYFHDRILSRNEIFNPISKTDNLKDLFPRGDLMVCIIDDREDVWNYARNLICVQPYVFFKNTGDINDPTQQQKNPKPVAKQPAEPLASKNKTNNTQTKPASKSNDQNVLTENELAIDNNSVDSSSSSSTNSNESTDAKSNSQNKISKQNKENQTSEQNQIETSNEQDINEDGDQNYDPDDYLIDLERILRNIHDEYYRIYEKRLKKKASSSDQVNESDLPDLKKVLPLIKSKVLENVVITFSGVVPTGYDLKKQRCYLMATLLGAKVNEHLVLPDSDGDSDESDTDESVRKARYEYSYDDDESSSSSNCSGGDKARKHANTNKSKRKQYTTHLVAAKHGTSKVHEAMKCKKISVVTPEWLINSNYRWTKCDEKLYKLTKEYDYKNCIFHNEYNMHQKYASVVGAQTNSAKLLSASKRNINNLQTNQQISVEAEFKTKKYKVNREDKEDDDEEEDNYDMKINEDLLRDLDKEVDKELDEDDDDDEEDDDEVDEDDDDDVAEEDDENEEKNAINKHDVSTTSDDADISSNAESIDEDMISALERDFN